MFKGKVYYERHNLHERIQMYLIVIKTDFLRKRLNIYKGKPFSLFPQIYRAIQC